MRSFHEKTWVDHALYAVPVCLLLLFLMFVSAKAHADDFNICWQPPTQFENGDPLLEQDLDFYTLYINDQNVMSFDTIVGTWCVIYTTHTEGTYFVKMTVTHVNGQTSGFSNETSFTLGPRRPMAPVITTVEAL